MPCGSSKDACNQDKNAANGHCAFEDLDHSVLQQPLNLGVTNIRQILKCVQGGSKEIRDIILNECNIIYECKVCVGLFRSLANFTYHKRCYCKQHMCEDMLLFENFDEEETITIQPEAPKEKSEDTNRRSLKMSDSAMDLDKSDITPETPGGSKEKNTNSSSNKGKAKEAPEAKKPESTMISRRTRDKNATNPISSTVANRMAAKMKAREEPPLKCAKVSSEKVISKQSDKLESEKSKELDASCKDSDKNVIEDNKLESVEASDDKVKETPSKGIKTQKIEFSKISGMLEKNMPSFPKIIFKTIESNQNAVFQSDDNKKLETFGLSKQFETATVETKMDNDKLIIVLKKDVKSDGTSDSKSESKQKSSAEKASDFHLTRRKRLMARSDCDVHDLKCLVCKTQFMSLKTLYFHMLSLHSKKRLYYPCPFCKTLFVQMYGVTRHLISIHNKTKEQTIKLKEMIKKKSVWKKVDDVNNPPYAKNISPLNYHIKEATPPPEIKTEPPKETENDSESSDSLKSVIKLGKNTTLHQCTKCNRVFGRKSSQVSHEKFCIMNTSVKTEGGDTPPVVQPVVQPSPPPVSPHVSSKQPVSFLSLPSKSPLSSKPISYLQFKAQNSPVKTAAPVVEKPVKPIIEKPVIDTKISIRPKRGAEKQMHKDFVNSQTLKWRSANRIDTNVNKTPAPPKKYLKDGKNLEKKVLGIMDAENLACLKCDKKFSSYSNLRRHVAIHVGWTRFKCKFCDYQAYNKSQCWAHVQKAHSVDENEMDKSILNLVNSNAPNKKSQLKGSHASGSKHNLEVSVKTSPKGTSIPKVKISRKKVMGDMKISHKKQSQIQKKNSEIKKVLMKSKISSKVRKDFSEMKKTLIKNKENPKETKDFSEIKKVLIKNKESPKETQNFSEIKKVLIKNKEIPKETILPDEKDIKIEEEDIESSESEMDKPWLAMPAQKEPKKNTIEIKKEKFHTTLTFQKFTKKDVEKDVKKEKSHHLIPIQKLTIPRETNYKSVTTSNPTTIILSKKIPASTVQSIVTISPESASSSSKMSPIRTSPRKTEIKGPGDRLITTLVTRSSAYNKSTPIQIKLPPKTTSLEELSKDFPDKNCSKKERLISEWFPKKDMSSSSVRRESAPLIIGLVPAGVNARVKSPAQTPEKTTPPP